MILERSRALFFERGVSALSMDDIASLQGISKKTLYRFFSNKDALLFSVVEDRIAFIPAEAAKIAADSRLSYLERLKNIMGLVGMQVAQISGPSSRTSGTAAGPLGPHRQVPARARLQHRHAAFRRRKERGVHPDRHRRPVGARALHQRDQRGAHPAQFVKLPVPPGKLFDAFIRILFGGILTEKAQRNSSPRRAGNEAVLHAAAARLRSALAACPGPPGRSRRPARSRQPACRFPPGTGQILHLAPQAKARS